MQSFRVFDRRARYIAAAFIVALSAFIPGWVSAAQVTERSIQLSSASADADNVTYEVKFKAVGAAAAFVIDFCGNSPIIGQACDLPAGFTAAGAATGTTDYTVASAAAQKVNVTSAVTAGENVSLELTGVNNPTSAGPLYARIVTFASTGGATSYTSASPGTYVDEGGVAISIVPSINVSAAVLESLTFCIAKNLIDPGCDLTGNAAPTIQLGETVGSAVALTADNVSDGSVYTQLSTNAASGAVVRIKSNAVNCGGLLRAGAPSACNIGPALAASAGIDPGEALFGVKAIAAADNGTNPNGTLQAINNYNDTTFVMNYTSPTVGVTGTYGDSILNTNGAPANGKNMQLTFGASISNNTPAGLYSADLSLIATGTF